MNRLYDFLGKNATFIATVFIIVSVIVFGAGYLAVKYKRFECMEYLLELDNPDAKNINIRSTGKIKSNNDASGFIIRGDITNVRAVALFYPWLEVLSLQCSELEDIAAIKDMKLNFFSTTGNIDDISPLKGIKKILLLDSNVSDISALKGTPLVVLAMPNAPLEDISPLKGIPLGWLDISNTLVSDISALMSAQLKALYIDDTKISDISCLNTSGLGELSLSNTPVSDISTLKGAPLEYLDISNTLVSDISVLEKMNIDVLRMDGTPAAKKELPDWLSKKYIYDKKSQEWIIIRTTPIPPPLHRSATSRF